MQQQSRFKLASAGTVHDMATGEIHAFGDDDLCWGTEEDVDIASQGGAEQARVDEPEIDGGDDASSDAADLFRRDHKASRQRSQPRADKPEKVPGTKTRRGHLNDGSNGGMITFMYIIGGM